jgi:Predicted periplasmic solute-binding protein
MMRVGRIPYVNCYPVYGAVDRGVVSLAAELVDGVPTELNLLMAEGALDVSVVSAVEYARAWEQYLLLPDLAISCDGPVRSVMLFSTRPATELYARKAPGQPKLDDERCLARAAVRERMEGETAVRSRRR